MTAKCLILLPSVTNQVNLLVVYGPNFQMYNIRSFGTLLHCVHFIVLHDAAASPLLFSYLVCVFHALNKLLN